MEATTTEIDTGVETANERLKTSDYDVEAYADDGENAMCWLIRRVDSGLIESQAVACEAGYRSKHGEAEVFDVYPETSTVEFARDHANADPKTAVELARKHFE